MANTHANITDSASVDFNMLPNINNINTNIAKLNGILLPGTSLSPYPSISATPLLPFILPSNQAMLAPTLAANPFQSQLEQKDKHIEVLEKAYWSLKTDFDKVCQVIETMNANNNKNCDKEKEKEQINQLRSKNVALENTIAEMKKQQHFGKFEDLKRKNRDANKKNSLLEKELKNLKNKLKRLEKENRRLCNTQSLEEEQRNAKQNALNQLYLSSKRISEFMNGMKKYRAQYETLKKRQLNLTRGIGKEDNEIFKIRMNDFYNDILKMESLYHSLEDSLDVMKTESQGKELDMITKDKQYIVLLEKEKLVTASHLDEYVRKNQTLQNDLTDREMKLRQTQNEISFVKQKLSQTEKANNQLMQQLQLLYVQQQQQHTNF